MLRERYVLRVASVVSVLLAGATWLGAAKNEATNARRNAPTDIKLGLGELTVLTGLRVRYEYFDSFDVKQYGTAGGEALLQERLWIDAEYAIDDSLAFTLRVQDARFWLSGYDDSDFSPFSPYQNPFDIRALHCEWKGIGDTPLGGKVGRQVIRYGDERIWGPGAWCSSGKFTWDAAKLFWRTDELDADFLWGRRVIADPDKLDFDHFGYHAGGLYAAIKKLPVKVDVFGVAKWNVF